MIAYTGNKLLSHVLQLKACLMVPILYNFSSTCNDWVKSGYLHPEVNNFTLSQKLLYFKLNLSLNDSNRNCFIPIDFLCILNQMMTSNDVGGQTLIKI